MDIMTKITHFTVISLNPVRRWPGVACLQAGSGPSPSSPLPLLWWSSRMKAVPKCLAALDLGVPPSSFFMNLSGHNITTCNVI